MNEVEPEELDTREQEESIEPIQQYHKRYEKIRKDKAELHILRKQRQELEVQLNLRKEKEKIKRIQNELDGKIYCDDCKEWFYPDHFE